MTNHATTPAINAAPMRPPTTPPAIAPAFDLLLCGVEDGVEATVVLDADELGVKVDWDTLSVDVGTIETLPVTSGESPVACAVEMFQLSPIDVSRKAHWGIRVPIGTGSGKVPAVALVVQLNDHVE
jgi:hypothetical protein